MVRSISINQNLYACKIKSTHKQYNFNHVGLASKKADMVSFTGRPIYMSIDNFMTKLLGVITTKDVKRIEKNINNFAKKYNKLNSIELKNLIKIKEEQLLANLEKYHIKFEKTEKEIKIIDELRTLRRQEINRIKNDYIKVISAKEAYHRIMQADALTINPSINDWFKNINNTSRYPNIFSSLFTHPIDRAKFVIGDFSIEIISSIEKRAALLSQKNLPTEQLERIRQKILSETIRILNKPEFKKTGILSDADMERLNQNVIKSIIYEKVYPKGTAFSKTVESIVVNSGKKLSEAKVGEIIDGYGLVIQKTSVYDKAKHQNVPCVAVFNKEKKDQSIQLIKIDLDLEDEVQEFIQKYKDLNTKTNTLNTENYKAQIEELEAKARAIIEKEDKLKVSRIYVRISPVHNLKFFLTGVENPEKFNSLSPYFDEIKRINEGEQPKISKIALVWNFKNSDAKRYHNAGKQVALSLIHLLKEHGCNDIFIQARASSKSAFPMYLRAGFKPISPTAEEIAEIMKTNLKWPADVPVFMYLPKTALVHDVVATEQPLKEIFEYKQI